MSSLAKTSLMLLTFFIGLATGFPLGLILAGVGVIFGFIFIGPHITPMYMSRIWSILNSWGFVAVPMFIMMGNLLGVSGIAEGLFKSFRYLLGPMRGGIAIAVIIVSTVFAACTGVIAASVTTMALLAMPILLHSGYSKNVALGSVMSGGTLGILIPPSIMLVILGPVGGVSVGKLFMGAIVPGLVLSLCYCIYVFVLCLIKPNEGPALSVAERAEMPIPARFKGALVNMVPPVLLVMGVLGSIFMGVATPTEAAGVGAFVALLEVIAYRRFSWDVMREVVTNTGKFLGMALIVATGAAFFSATFIAIGGSDVVRDFVMSTGSKWGAFFIMNFIVFFLGFFMSWMGIIFIVIPLFMPIAAELGFDLIWFAIILCINLQSSFMTPPFGYALFYIKALVPQIDPSITIIDIYKSVVPYIIIIFVVVALCVFFPQIILWLPAQAVG